MDQAIAKMIRGISSWDDLRQFQENAAQKGRLTDELKQAVSERSFQLGRELIERKTRLNLSELSPAERKIIDAVSVYVAIKKASGRNAERTFLQLSNRGLLGAAESAVCRTTPTEGFKTLAEADQSEVSYEQIVLDHPDEFSERAIWHAREALGLPNDSGRPPALETSDTQTRTQALLSWLKESARANDEFIPLFTNEDTAAKLNMADMQKYGRVIGNIQSRIDFACYRIGLPPLGLAADHCFDKAWTQERRDWAFPIKSMQQAAQSKQWSDNDFDAILRETERLPGQAHQLWKEALAREQDKVKAWAFGLGDALGSEIENAGEAKRNPKWARDELILALDLYMKYRSAPLAQDAAEINELAGVLNALGTVLGQRATETYWNANGVYMKLMYFRRHDPQYASEGRTGPTLGNRDEVRVWEEFAGDLSRLAEVAEFIRNGIKEHSGDENISGPDDPGIEEAEEGKVATRVHRYRERDRRLVQEAKKLALQKHGKLFCAACGFNFTDRYGQAGNGIIDVHHTKPVHTMQPGEKSKVVDLALLCSNCHRVVHSNRRWLTIEQVRAALQPKSLAT